jgi:D-glycero-alpha-D-manno-heptose-7-phosphate kinase
MIISRTPFRMSFFGGGTDYPSWSRRHGGAVLAVTLDKYCYLTCRYLPPFFEHKYRVVYSKIENAQTIDQIAHPSVRAALQFLRFERGIEIHHDGDLPARSGVGSSSAFAVGLLQVLHALRGQMVSKHELALQAIHLEQELLGETVGSQDQVLAAYGGLNHVLFRPDGQILVQPLVLGEGRLSELTSHLMLFYTGIKRTASDVAASYAVNPEDHARQLHLIGGLVDRAVTLLTSGQDINGFGELLHEAWLAKRSLSRIVSNDEVDGVYAAARRAGALGGKLMGAGGGGFLLLFVPPTRQLAVRRKLGALLQVPFSFDYTGSQILYFSQERDYSAVEQDRRRVPLAAFRELSEVRKAV